jgi:VanZ family protein
MDAIAFGFGHPGARNLMSVGAVVLCAGNELGQLFVPSRHARLSDFIVDMIAALLL